MADADPPPPTPFSQWLAAMGSALGYPRDSDLARALRIPQSTVSRWRKGSRPTVEHLVHIGRLFGTELEPLLVVTGHVSGVPGEDPFRTPAKPPVAVTKTVRKIRDADMPDQMKTVLLDYWDTRLAEERARLYSFIAEFGGPPTGNPDMDVWLAKAFETDMPKHVVSAFMALLTLQVERTDDAPRRAGRGGTRSAARTEAGEAKPEVPEAAEAEAPPER